jgi:putative membrane protein
MRAGRAALFAIWIPLAALAHAGEPIEPHDLWTAWRFDLGVVIPLAVSALLYARGARVPRGVTRRQKVCFWAGWLALVVALVSPIHPLGEALFSAHMVQHELLMLIAAPLLALSRPLVPMLWGLPLESRRTVGGWTKAPSVQRAWRAITAPAAAWCLHAVAIWIWHAPPLFQATLTSELAHSAQHLSFFLSALLFWWSLFYAHGRTAYGAAVLYVFTTGVHTSILGALLTFTPTLWYPAYVTTAPAWGMTPLDDQQTGGLVMWIPAGLVYLGVGLALFAAWLRESDERTFPCRPKLRQSC